MIVSIVIALLIVLFILALLAGASERAEARRMQAIHAEQVAYNIAQYQREVARDRQLDEQARRDWAALRAPAPTYLPITIDGAVDYIMGRK